MDEYIDREALMRKIKEIHCDECNSYHGVRCRACWVDDTFGYIESEPAADVAPVRHGRWEWCKDYDGDSILVCSECGRVCSEEDAPYCYCGCKMDLEG